MPDLSKTTVAAVLVALALSTPQGLAGDAKSPSQIDLSPKLGALLKAEMAELSGGLQTLAAAIPAADWSTIVQTSEKMRDSYLMKQSLTEAQALELRQKLPTAFKQLDAAFHARANKLRQAAASKDAELVAFHFSRLVESCAGCHSAFATERFPGFANEPQEHHRH